MQCHIFMLICSLHSVLRIECCLLGLYSEHHFPFKSHISHLFSHIGQCNCTFFLYRIEVASSSSSYLLPCEKCVWLVLFL